MIQNATNQVDRRTWLHMPSGTTGPQAVTLTKRLKYIKIDFYLHEYTILKLTCYHINRRHFCFNIKYISVHPLLWMNVMLDFICMVFAGM